MKRRSFCKVFGLGVFGAATGASIPSIVRPESVVVPNAYEVGFSIGRDATLDWEIEPISQVELVELYPMKSGEPEHPVFT